MGLRILFPYDGERAGGHVVSSLLLARGLAERGHAVGVAVHGPGPVAEMARAHGLATIALARLGAVSETARRDGLRLGNLTAAPGAVRLIRAGGYDIVHTNDKRMLRTWGLPAAGAGARLIAHWRSFYLPSVSLSLPLMLARRILCVSRYSYDSLPGFAQRRAEVIYNPFPDQLSVAEAKAARAEIRAQLGIPADAALVGVFGSLIARKRPHLLLDLLQALPERLNGRAVWGLVCGERAAPADEAFDARLREHPALLQRCCIPGRVAGVQRYMASCDVVIAPSVNEPFARVAVEAQGAGTPVIVSRDGGLREFIADGESGFIVDPEDLAGWADTVRRVIEDAALAQRLSAAGRAAAAQLTLERHVEAVLRAYAGANAAAPAANAEAR